MRRSGIHQRHVLAGVVVLLLVSSLLPGGWVNSYSRAPRHLLGAITAPLTRPLKRLSDAIRRPAEVDVFGNDPSRWKDALESEVQYRRRLEQELREARDNIAQLSHVRQHLDLSGFELKVAYVTHGSNDPAHPALTISRGRRDGLQPGFVVASGFNLVGRVTSVGPASSTVTLITAADTLLSTRIVPVTLDAPPREHLAQLRPQKGAGRFTAQANVDDPVEVGDLAHLADHFWPPEAQALVVGSVTAIEKDPSDPLLRRIIEVMPPRSLAYLDRVVVLVPTQGGVTSRVESDAPEGLVGKSIESP